MGFVMKSLQPASMLKLTLTPELYAVCAIMITLEFFILISRVISIPSISVNLRSMNIKSMLGLESYILMASSPVLEQRILQPVSSSIFDRSKKFD